MNPIIKTIRQELKQLADPKTKQTARRFFKENIKLYGLNTPATRKIARKHFQLIKKDLPITDIFSLCDPLWQSGYLEESIIACHWSYSLRKNYAPENLKTFERWLNDHVTNWASCDTLCNHTIGEFLEQYPEYLPALKRWTQSKNRWLRRAAAVSLIVPAKKGKFLKDIFDIADKLLTDPDDLVQKGYGWLLKAASHSHQKQVFDYIIKNKTNMPRTALRYAIEKLPTHLKQQAMRKTTENHP